MKKKKAQIMFPQGPVNKTSLPSSKRHVIKQVSLNLTRDFAVFSVLSLARLYPQLGQMRGLCLFVYT